MREGDKSPFWYLMCALLLASVTCLWMHGHYLSGFLVGLFGLEWVYSFRDD
jgi:hypothetical protein